MTLQNQIKLIQVDDGLKQYLTRHHLTSLSTLLLKCMLVHHDNLLSFSFVLAQIFSQMFFFLRSQWLFVVITILFPLLLLLLGMRSRSHSFHLSMIPRYMLTRLTIKTQMIANLHSLVVCLVFDGDHTLASAIDTQLDAFPHSQSTSDVLSIEACPLFSLIITCLTFQIASINLVQVSNLEVSIYY